MKTKILLIIICSFWICQSAVAQKSVVTQRNAGGRTFLAQVKPMGSKLWGYINLEGDIVIEPKFSKSFPFSEDGFAPVYDPKEKEYCFIDASGNKLNTEIKDFDLLSILGFGVKGFSDGLVPVRKNKRWGFLDTGGNIRIDLKYEKVTEFNGGYAIARIRDDFFVLDQTGAEIPVDIERLDNVKHFSEGLAPFYRVDDRVGFIDEQGNIAIQAQFRTVGYFSGGLAWAKTSDKLIGFIDRAGEWVISPQFLAAKDFSPHDGLARVKQEDGWCYVNEHGEIMRLEDTDVIGTFYEGLCKGRKDDLVGFFDTNGEWVIPPQFESVRDFKNGYAAARVRDKWGLINMQGEWVIEPEYAAIRDMEMVY